MAPRESVYHPNVDSFASRIGYCRFAKWHHHPSGVPRHLLRRRFARERSGAFKPLRIVHTPMNRIAIVAALLACSLIVTASCAVAAPPNIVVMLTDDQGWGDLSVHGNTNLHTPAADSLAVTAPCSSDFMYRRFARLRGPSFYRAIILAAVSLARRPAVNDWISTSARSLRCFKVPATPRARLANGTTARNTRIIQTAAALTSFMAFARGTGATISIRRWNTMAGRCAVEASSVMTSRPCDGFIEAKRGEPFFCYLALNTPHSPMQVPDRFYDKFANAEIPLRQPGPEPKTWP